MHLLESTLTGEDNPEEDCLWDVGLPLQVPPNRSSTVEALRKLR